MAVRRIRDRLFDHRVPAALVLGIVLLAAASSSPAYIQSAEARPNAATITLSPSPAAIAGCDTTVTVSVMINDVVGLYGADVRLAFDPNMLEVVDANGAQSGIQSTPGGFLTGSLFTVYNTADNSLGTIRYAATQISPTLPADGTGALINLLFRARAGGTSNITFTSAQLADRSGQAIPAAASDGSVAAGGPAASTLAIAKLTGAAARLSWTGAAGVSEYRLYRATTPYFTPADPPYATTTDLIYTDTNALGNTSTNYYYVVRSACANGLPSGNSNRVGEFDLAVARDAYNTVTVPLLDSSLATADDLGSATGAVEVSQWIADTQGLDTRLVGFLGNNFALSTGRGYFLYTPGSGPTVFTMVGRVPPAASVSFPINRGALACRLNLLSLPLDQDAISTADALAAAIGGVPEISEWKAAPGGFDTRIAGSVGTNFVTRAGYPYWPCAAASGGAVWP